MNAGRVRPAGAFVRVGMLPGIEAFEVAENLECASREGRMHAPIKAIGESGASGSPCQPAADTPD